MTFNSIYFEGYKFEAEPIQSTLTESDFKQWNGVGATATVIGEDREHLNSYECNIGV